MSRYRPPAAKSSPYITRAGYDALQAELTELWKRKRPALVLKVAEAAALGDRSENAEYTYGKKQLHETDRRIRYLSRRLDELTVVERLPADRTRVRFGAWVEVENAAGEGSCYQLVGADEADASAGRISVDAPFARALLNQRAGAAVTVGGQAWRLKSIRYATETAPGGVQAHDCSNKGA